MKVVLDTDLWLHEQDGVTHASAPWITNMKTGEGMPGISAVPVKVVRRGTELDVTILKVADVVPSDP